MELDDEIECDLEGLSFDCLFKDEAPVDGFNATIETRIKIEGDWTTSTSFDSAWSMELICSGSDCGDFSDTCVVSWAIEGELDE